MIYKFGRKWAIVGGTEYFATKEEAEKYAGIKARRVVGQNSTRNIPESTDRRVFRPSWRDPDTVTDSGDKRTEQPEV